MSFTADTLPFNTIAALVRTGTAFDNRYILNSCTARLKAEYPSCFGNWDIAQNTGLKRISPMPFLHFQVVALCREQGFATILPSALYQICRDHKLVSSSIFAFFSLKVKARINWSMGLKMRNTISFDLTAPIGRGV